MSDAVDLWQGRPKALLPGRFLITGASTFHLRDSDPYRRRNLDAVPIVLLHGLTSTADLTWFSVTSALASKTRVLAPDLPGHGSSPFNDRFDFAEIADELARILKAELGRPAIVVGFSMGGAVAQVLCRRHPDAVAGLVFCSSAAQFRSASALSRLVSEPSRRALVAASVRSPGPIRRLVGRSLRAATLARVAEKRGAGSTGAEGGAELQTWAREQLCRGDHLGVAAAAAAMRRFDATSWVSSISAPCCAVLTAGDSVVPIQAQRSLASAVGAIDTIELDGEHDMFIKHPESWSAAVVRACDVLTAAIAATA